MNCAHVALCVRTMDLASKRRTSRNLTPPLWVRLVRFAGFTSACGYSSGPAGDQSSRLIPSASTPVTRGERNPNTLEAKHPEKSPLLYEGVNQAFKTEYNGRRREPNMNSEPATPMGV
jgi:hypothetical protein